jgi:molybdopterin-guanine dinucleotide biosynthesis protein
MVGLQGSGKTTTTAKIAKRLTEQQKRKVLGFDFAAALLLCSAYIVKQWSGRIL